MRAQRVVLVAVSVCALVTLIAGSALGLEGRVESWLIEPEPDLELATPVPVSVPVPVPVPDLPPAAVAAEPLAPEAGPTTAITIPDLDGMRLSRARRVMRELGLRMTVRDEWGNAIDADGAFYYRVRGSTLEPAIGTEVEPGARVRGRVRAIQVAASGY